MAAGHDHPPARRVVSTQPSRRTTPLLELLLISAVWTTSSTSAAADLDWRSLVLPGAKNREAAQPPQLVDSQHPVALHDSAAAPNDLFGPILLSNRHSNEQADLFFAPGSGPFERRAHFFPRSGSAVSEHGKNPLAQLGHDALHEAWLLDIVKNLNIEKTSQHVKVAQAVTGAAGRSVELRQAFGCDGRGGRECVKKYRGGATLIVDGVEKIYCADVRL